MSATYYVWRDGEEHFLSVGQMTDDELAAFLDNCGLTGDRKMAGILRRERARRERNNG